MSCRSLVTSPTLCRCSRYPKVFQTALDDSVWQWNQALDPHSVHRELKGCCSPGQPNPDVFIRKFNPPEWWIKKMRPSGDVVQMWIRAHSRDLSPKDSAPKQLLCPGNVPQLCQRKRNPLVSSGSGSSQSFLGVNTAELVPHRAINQIRLCNERESRWMERRLFPPSFPCSVSSFPPAKCSFLPVFCRVCVSGGLFSLPVLFRSRLLPRHLWNPWELENTSPELGGTQDIRTVHSSCPNPT